MKTYTIFGGGPSGLYTAWRLLDSGKLASGDQLEIIEWGDYDYAQNGEGTRLPAGRICTYHYQNCSKNSYIEVGGMRFIEWDDEKKEGHQLVTTTIHKLGLDGQKVPFNTTDDPLLFVRGQHMYQSEINFYNRAPYDTNTSVDIDAEVKVGNQFTVKETVSVPANAAPADDLIGSVSNAIVTKNATNRVQQCQFYSEGVLPDGFESYVYKTGDLASNIGYWNILYDQAYNEGYQYAADANGYSSNVINWNAADAAVYNGEFAPGGKFKTLKTGMSSLFVSLYNACISLAENHNIDFKVTKSTRLHSIWSKSGKTLFHTASACNPDTPSNSVKETDYAFLAMPPHAVKAVAAATRYLPEEQERVNFLNQTNVSNYLESVIEQPSFKAAMFFDTPWWEDNSLPFKPKVNTYTQTYGPTITDLPIRQVYYFGNNAPVKSTKPVYGILASYDDMRFTNFWRELEWSIDEQHTVAPSTDTQPLVGAKKATNAMQRMLRLQLARLHYGNEHVDPKVIPKPLETTFMDWGHNPFGAGYHAWASHYNICKVMQDIRTPELLAGMDKSANVFIIGSAFSNDQAWIEGAFCTAESVLMDYFHIDTIATDLQDYPLICGTCDIRM
ncbi:flavin monoamine oxidase family protein [Pseudoalteromonas luteoviolacea]|uniref:Amine oxidase domain-containing protein n=1 Tax=Pseudoalteromonas luteoviolacea S4054 TaxID=1129367 RepID=A0A0F6ADJ6_9GAMM|nr:FAD-dependent oxidoreductase [Pseudoalteromonas luteoviolacea]AOT08307.1 hypothetical protein S4054249_10825 [Pseudoalteromonas luteoviolacea]AOT13223.1 hypothetical protein S40542_10800 [Pseudoalteromonas luteoviolacea]AOT18136.1 hypothetical protein S4054_10800 [Pseudoalteromonas luteoviolacea]KKE84243.1 hypothetical protein N479_10110 [Pseudoalteromonas luteoviolacea S4054]KZN76152.1 hypothetical protein N481_07305 [Pseudoalteromonas luteoviolacea S4047-1]